MTTTSAAVKPTLSFGGESPKVKKKKGNELKYSRSPLRIYGGWSATDVIFFIMSATVLTYSDIYKADMLDVVGKVHQHGWEVGEEGGDVKVRSGLKQVIRDSMHVDSSTSVRNFF